MEKKLHFWFNIHVLIKFEVSLVWCKVRSPCIKIHAIIINETVTQHKQFKERDHDDFFNEWWAKFLIIIKKNVVWLPMRQLSTRDQMTQIITIGHSTDFNNEISPYHMVRYKRPRNDKCKTIQTRKQLYLCTKNERKTNM